MGITDFFNKDKSTAEVIPPAPTEQEKYISVAQACEILGVSDETLRRWEKRGKIHSYQLPTPNHTGERTRPIDYRGKRYKLSEIEAIVQPNP